MTEIDKITFRSQLPVYLAQLALCAVMVGVYAVLGKLSQRVIFGAVLGAATSLLNYSVMIFSLLKAAKSDSPERAQLKARGNYILRMLLLMVGLVVALKFGPFDPLATLLPLILMRIALFLGGLLIKKGAAV
ncbi:MAG: hypothetical protein E7467_02235 [Ruminococcaceae bacterium]|nr:hypothetical protein [Oscillospiraceae bacterium]